MKIQLIVLFFTLFLSVNLLAQNPTWINQSASMNFGFSKYSDEGYNEQAYLWQNALLKGNVHSCIIAENITDSLMAVGVKYGQYLRRLSYNMEFVYNLNKQLEQLIINDETVGYKTPKTIKNIREESLTWILDKIQTRAYWYDEDRNYLVNYIYNDAGQIKKEHWGTISPSAKRVSIFPFEVLYEYKEDGAYTIAGALKETFDLEEGIAKYFLEFDEKGQLTKRTLYNRELRDRAENNSSDLETFVYTYSEEGYLTSMTFAKGSAAPTTHRYKYIKEDKFGNWQIQQVYDDKQALLFEMKRDIIYGK